MKNLLYNTRPIIFHVQGKSQFCQLWDKGNALCGSYKKVPDNLKIVTFNNGCSFGGKAAGSLERSLQGQCFVMGRGVTDWRNSMKISLLVKFLEISRVEYVLGVDSSDVAVYSLEGILEKFFAKKCELLFNAEVNFWPKADFEEGW